MEWSLINLKNREKSEHEKSEFSLSIGLSPNRAEARINFGVKKVSSTPLMKTSIDYAAVLMASPHDRLLSNR